MSNRTADGQPVDATTPNTPAEPTAPPGVVGPSAAFAALMMGPTEAALHWRNVQHYLAAAQMENTVDGISRAVQNARIALEVLEFVVQGQAL